VTVTEEQERAAQPALVRSILLATPAEQHLLLSWARGLGGIRQRDLPVHKKAVAALKLTRDSRATWPFLKVLARALKQLAWDARSWKLRLGVGAVVVTIATVGNGAAGIVALGAGLGLPLWVLTGFTGVLAGMLLDAIKQKAAKSRSA
jgi:hypothetical protein